MRIVIDLQAAQGGNARRGVGRYAMSLVRAMARLRGEHEVIIALSDLFPSTVEPIRQAFDGLLPSGNIRVWSAPPLGGAQDRHAGARRRAAELVREAFLASLQPDWILVASLFEDIPQAIAGVGNLGTDVPTAVILYDLIPRLYPALYLRDDTTRLRYETQLAALGRADLLLAISAASGADAVRTLGFDPLAVVNISGAADTHFRPLTISSDAGARLVAQYRLTRPFVLYTGGIDPRKNIEGLIRAWARLPRAVRAAHQLAVVCAFESGDGQRLRALAAQAGLADDELVLTGYVPEDDLVALYNLCRSFVFPSLYEGFGLPVLEAMACGAAVVASSSSSLPEVVGRDDVLFDPTDDAAITRALARVLGDAPWRESLRAHGLAQAARFSWDACARTAWQALEAAGARRAAQAVAVPMVPSRKPRLAYVSPLPPQKSGIAGHSALLLPSLAQHYEIDVIVHQDEVTDEWVLRHCPVRSTDWLRSHSHEYDRVLYHFGNSHFHTHMFALLDEVPGVVVLHDFFLSGIVSVLENEAVRPHAWSRELYAAHGYAGMRRRYFLPEGSPGVWTYPGSFNVLRAAQGVIVHSEGTRRLARQWYGDGITGSMQVVPLVRGAAPATDRAAARRRLGLADDEFLACSFGMLGPTKLNQRLLDVWLDSPLARDTRCRLVFVGENLGDGYGDQLVDTLRRSPAGARVRITGWVAADLLEDYLAAADVAVQLRSSERRELSAAFLDCMNHGVATIANADASAGDVPDDAAWMLDEDFEDDALADALQTLRRDRRRREAMGARARLILSEHHRPAICAQQYAQAIELFYRRHPVAMPALLTAALARQEPELGTTDHLQLAKVVARNHPVLGERRQLLVDVSELVRRDARSGIQRVTRSILHELLMNPPEGFRVEPVWGTLQAVGYRYARRFISRFLGVPDLWAADDPVEARAGDVFLGLDLQPYIVPVQRPALVALRQRGVRTYFVVYDLLATTRPEFFVPVARRITQEWLQTVAESDGAICISRVVGNELRQWLDVFGGPRQRPFRIGWFHLGADVENSVPSRGMPADAPQVLAELGARPTFIVVGTVEPRKGHAQTLSAFEHLWAHGDEINLVIVGGQGWQVEALVDRLRVHSQRGRRLFWLEGISDEYLERIYATATALLAPSEAEGFGLPLIEGAQKGLPLIVRDLPVFREVAGSHAYYFPNRTEPDFLIEALRAWMALYRRGAHPRSQGLRYLDWAGSTRQLLRGPLQDIWHREWLPDAVRRYWGSDPRLSSQVGRANGIGIETTGKDGFLIYGPYEPFAAGRYRLTLQGEGRQLDGQGCWLDITCDLGDRVLATERLPAFGNVLQMPVDFVLDRPTKTLEFRVHVDIDASLRVDRVTIESTDRGAD